MFPRRYSSEIAVDRMFNLVSNPVDSSCPELRSYYKCAVCFEWGISIFIDSCVMS